MLSFQIINAGRSIQITCDSAGASSLIETLKHLQLEGGHVHFLSNSNGGKELDERTSSGEDAIGEVVITIRGD
jgi:hypothetical protein